MVDNLDTLMDIRVAQLEETQQRFNQNDQFSVPKIQRISKFLQKNERFVNYCSPKAISFGPIHHNTDNVKESEHYKLLWTSRFVAEYGRKINEDGTRACRLLFKKFEDKIEELKNMFTEDAIEKYNDSELGWMLFVDGCSLLHFMENFDHQCPERLNLKLDQLMYMWRDVLLLENQLPSKMLEILCKERGIHLAHCFSNYYSLGENKGNVVVTLENPNPVHVLDCCRSLYLSSLDSLHMCKVSDFEKDNHHHMETRSSNKQMTTRRRRMAPQVSTGRHNYKSVCDLKKAGIRVMANKTEEWRWSNISFTSKWFGGELRLPSFFFNDVTPYLFRNLIAFEMCPDFQNMYECCSFFTLMDSLVDSAEDVKELRLAGVFQNLLGSDQELANLLNELGDDLPTKMSCHFMFSNTVVAYTNRYFRVRNQIKRHCGNKWKTWLAEAYNTHFNTPWAMMAFFAALLALILTFLQTWFTIHPK